MTQPLIDISRKTALLFAAFLVLYEFLTYIANDMIMPGMLDVVRSFNAPQSAVATSLTAYILGGASLQLFLGPISDRYGRRPVMLFGAVFFLICTILIAATISIDQFLIARFFQGMGLCFISVIGYATLQEIFEEMDAIRLIAIMANIAILAPLLGPLVGAVVIHYYTWRFIFIAIAVFAFIDLIGLWIYMPEPIGKVKRDGNKIKRESLAPKVVINNYINLFKTKGFLFGSFALGIVMLPCMLWIAFSPIILIKKAELTVLQYGLWQIPIFGAAIIGNVILQYLTYKISAVKIIHIGTAILVVGLLLLAVLPLLNAHYLWIIPGTLLYFLAVGMIQAPLSRWILFSTEVVKGTTSALMTLICMIIQAAGIEVGNIFQVANSNIIFGIFCAITGLIYFIVLIAAFHYGPRKTSEVLTV